MTGESSVPLWVLLLVLGALGSLVMLGLALMVAHFKRDQETRERVAVHDQQIKVINAEIGDRKSGIRGWLHELANEITPRSIKRQQQERDE